MAIGGPESTERAYVLDEASVQKLRELLAKVTAQTFDLSPPPGTAPRINQPPQWAKIKGRNGSVFTLQPVVIQNGQWVANPSAEAIQAQELTFQYPNAHLGDCYVRYWLTRDRATGQDRWFFSLAIPDEPVGAEHEIVPAADERTC